MTDATMLLWWLEQTGPGDEKKMVAGPEEADILKQKGLAIAASLGNAGAVWSGNNLKVSDDVSLKVTTASKVSA
jgi:hypothetical protein